MNTAAPPLGAAAPAADYYALLRFLRARNYELDKALKMWADTLEWRREYEVDTILDAFVFHEREQFLMAYPQGYHKTDKLVRRGACAAAGGRAGGGGGGQAGGQRASSRRAAARATSCAADALESVAVSALSHTHALPRPPTHTHTHTHARTHLHARACTHALARARTHARTHLRAHALTHARTGAPRVHPATGQD
jgi:hypothetical protein